MKHASQVLVSIIAITISLPIFAQSYSATPDYRNFLSSADALNGKYVTSDYCSDYAHLAVAQTRRDRSMGCDIVNTMNDNPSRWSTDLAPQYNWCLTVSSQATKNEAIHRENQLKKCSNRTKKIFHENPNVSRLIRFTDRILLRSHFFERLNQCSNYKEEELSFYRIKKLQSDSNHHFFTISAKLRGKNLNLMLKTKKDFSTHSRAVYDVNSRQFWSQCGKFTLPGEQNTTKFNVGDTAYLCKKERINITNYNSDRRYACRVVINRKIQSGDYKIEIMDRCQGHYVGESLWANQNELWSSRCN